MIMDKKIVMIGMIVGSMLGGWLPTLFGISAFSVTSVLCGGVGGIIGIWICYKMIS
jgi:hypothetical protein